MNDIERVNVNACKPFHHIAVFFHNVIVVEILACNRAVLGTYLLTGNLVNTAVDSVEKTFCKVCSCSEELHFLADLHRGYTASDSVIVAVNGTHKVVVLVLNCVMLDRHLCAEFLEVFGKMLAPENREVGLGCSTDVVKSVKISE